MNRRPQAVLIRERNQPLAVPPLGVCCTSEEFPGLCDGSRARWSWKGLAKFDGVAVPYPVEPDGPIRAQLHNSIAVLVTDSHLIGIVRNGENLPSIWIAAPIGSLDVSIGLWSGIVHRRPFEIVAKSSGWRLGIAPTHQLDPATRAERTCDDGAGLLEALGGPHPARHYGSKPGDRPMIGMCTHGHPSADPDTLPAFDGHGALVPEAGEVVQRTGTARCVTTSAKAARGREQFQTMWNSGEQEVELVLTDRRLVYRAPNADPNTGRSLAGQIRQASVVNLIAGDGSDFGAAHLHRTTVTVIDPPVTAIRVHFLFAAGDRSFEDGLIRSAAAWRERAFPECEYSAPDKWRKLLAQKESPTFADGYWGPLAELPLACSLGEELPRA